MPLSPEQRELFSQLRSENLSTEIKETLDLSTEDGRAKLVKACHAIFNRNGGHFLVGFDDSGLPKPLAAEELKQFTPDAIQEIISRHSVPTFEVDLDFVEIDSNRFPVISIPSGVRIPTSVRKEIKSQDGRVHIIREAIYFRTLLQNGRASTSLLRPGDFPELFDICFGNRETDIASFLRKHLPDLTAGNLSLFSGTPSVTDQLSVSMADFDELTSIEVSHLGTPKPAGWLLSALTLKSVVMCDPAIPSDGISTEAFLSKVYSSNPNLTGWPVWMDTRNFSDRRAAPHVYNGGWNTIVPFGAFGDGLEIHRFEPSGRLFFRRVLQDDTSEKVERGNLLDPALMVYRVAEVVIVALSILRNIGASEESVAHFRFDWMGLKGRKIGSWSDVNRYFSSRTAFEDSASAHVSIPTSVAPKQVAPFVGKVVRSLFATFEGFEIAETVVDDLVAKLVDRRM